MESMFKKLTDRSKKVLTLAADQAAELAHDVHSGHVLLGLFLEGAGVAAVLLRDRELEYQAILGEVAIQCLDKPQAENEMHRLNVAAMHSAHRLGHLYIGTEHLLLGICILPSLSGASALAGVDVMLSEVGKEILCLLGHGDLTYHQLASSLQL